MFSDIENYYEHLVFERIRNTLTKEEEKSDGAYLEDVACVALNHLPPRYARHSVDLAFHLTDAEWGKMNKEVVAAVDNAIEFTRRRREQRPAEAE